MNRSLNNNEVRLTRDQNHWVTKQFLFVSKKKYKRLNKRLTRVSNKSSMLYPTCQYFLPPVLKKNKHAVKKKGVLGVIVSCIAQK